MEADKVSTHSRRQAECVLSSCQSLLTHWISSAFPITSQRHCPALSQIPDFSSHFWTSLNTAMTPSVSGIYIDSGCNKSILDQDLLSILQVRHRCTKDVLRLFVIAFTTFMKDGLFRWPGDHGCTFHGICGLRYATRYWYPWCINQ